MGEWIVVIITLQYNESIIYRLSFSKLHILDNKVSLNTQSKYNFEYLLTHCKPWKVLIYILMTNTSAKVQ
jgi:hypothetical protein